MKKDRYIAEVQKELFKDFEGGLRNMTISQGAILLKLIDRETGQSSYSIIKTYKNGAAAGFWMRKRRHRPAVPAYALKLSFRLTLRLKTRWPSRLSLLSRQK